MVAMIVEADKEIKGFSQEDIAKALAVAIRLQGFQKDDYIKALRFIRQYATNSTEPAAKYLAKLRAAPEGAPDFLKVN